MTQRPRLATLQALRALAALMIVVGHSIIELPAMRGGPGYLRSFQHVFGVWIFFVISGFIMAYTAEEDFGSAQGRKDFMISRLSRIVPLYWALTTVTLALSIAIPRIFNSPRPTTSTLINSYLFIPLKNPEGFAFPVLVPGWSLNYEMFFYTLFLCAMFMPRRAGIASLVVTIVVLAVAGATWHPANDLLQAYTVPWILLFAIGVLIAHSRRRLKNVPPTLSVAALLLGVALFIPANFALDPGSPLGIVDELAAATLIVLGAVMLDLRGVSIAPVALVLVGDASYSLYLSHMFIVRLVRVAWNAAKLPVEPILFCVLVVLIASGFAICLASWIELPLHRWLRDRFVARRQVTSPAMIERLRVADKARPAHLTREQ